MPVTAYKSTDASAPQLDGSTNGTLVSVLDACLVNGYGAKAAAGWTKAFSGTNQAVYRMNAVSGAGHYLHVNDSSPNTSAVGREARARGWVTSTGLGTGTEAFPTVAQIADTAGPMIRKSVSADAVARAWRVYADDRTFYLFTKSGDFGNIGWNGYGFGEFFSLQGIADLYRTMLMGRIVSAGAGQALDSSENMDLFSAPATALAGHYTPRTWNNDLAGAVQFGKHGNSSHNASLMAGVNAFPNWDGSAMVSLIWATIGIGGQAQTLGRLRGLGHLLHLPSAVNDLDQVIVGAKTYELLKGAKGTSVYAVEISNTWETNT
jgi:hypothetical protein